MITSTEENYYSRQILLEEIGEEGQLKLRKSSVLVVGAGGLGCPLLQYLAGVGVGTIGIVDGDSVEISNLHRQTLFGIDALERNKALAAQSRLNDLNPFVKVVSYPFFLNTSNGKDLFEKYDLIVDCSDNYPTRFLINDFCVLYNKPLISGSIYRFEGQVSVFNFQGGPTYRCLFPELPSEKSITNCSASGVIGVLPGIIGLFQANEVFKIITGIGEVLTGKILLYNSLKNTFNSIEIARNPNINYEEWIIDGKLMDSNYIMKCSLDSKEIKSISEQELIADIGIDNLLFLDVRFDLEEPFFTNEMVLKIPLDRLMDEIELIPKNRKLIVFCKSGIRSKMAVERLQEKGFSEIYNLKGGITSQIIELWKKKQKV